MDTNEIRLKDQEAIARFRELVKDVNTCMFTTLDAYNQISSLHMFTSFIEEYSTDLFYNNEFTDKIK